MRVFYIGKLREGTTSFERMKVLNSLGHQTVPFNISAFESLAPRVVQSIAWRLHAGPMVSKINNALWREGQNLNGIHLIWVDKGVWIYPETIQYLKKMTSARAVHYTPDSQILSQRSRHFLASIPLYDVLVTTKEWEVEAYKKAGARHVLLTYQGYDSRFYPRMVPEPERSQYESDVCFIGHTQPHYAQRLKALSSVGIKLRIWGDAWLAYAKRHPWARGLVGPGLWGESYPVALACAKIGLGLLGKHIPETSTTRTFEIPATGTFLLAERTDLHQQLFDEGKEAEFFSSDDEMIDKVKFYLAHDEARQRIAAGGRARCERSGYSNFELLRKLTETLERLE
ncbi:MAG: glycosyltransferase [Caldilineales bacterium]|nr:glycosyltransferase [Caldilineales bacterium]